MFAPERAASPVLTLSGGERNRLLLARLFARPANVLVLDEPTNDLDIDTLELLEQLLQDYKGTVFLVSHDRAFLDNVVTSIIAYEGDGYWREYEGGYEDWKIQKKRTEEFRAAQSTSPVTSSEANKPTANKDVAPVKAKSTIQKLNSKERQELEDIPSKIDALEVEQAQIGVSLGDGDLYKSNPDQVIKFQERLKAIEEQLTQLMARWEDLLKRSESA